MILAHCSCCLYVDLNPVFASIQGAQFLVSQQINAPGVKTDKLQPQRLALEFGLRRLTADFDSIRTLEDSLEKTYPLRVTFLEAIL